VNRERGMRDMERKGIRVGLMVLVFLLGMVPCVVAQEAKTDSDPKWLGIQASTNFQEMMAGVRIKARDFAVTPKFGFFVQDLDNGTAYNIGFGCGFDYYLRRGSLRPYVGGDVLLYIPHVSGTTDVWAVLSPHIGIEQWIGDAFSIGANLGMQFGFGDSFYTPNTIDIVGKSNFSFGINGMLHVTYYFG
jgi:hypothetical protein